MSNTTHSSNLDILVGGHTQAAQDELTELIAQGANGFQVSGIGFGADRFPTLVNSAIEADVLIFATNIAQGLFPQARRQIKIAYTLGVRHFLLVVNQSDGTALEKSEYEAVKSALDTCLNVLAGKDGSQITSAVIEYSNSGSALIDALNDIETQIHDQKLPLRMVVEGVGEDQSVTAVICSGIAGVDDNMIGLPSATRTSIEQILCDSKRVDTAGEGQTVELKLADDIDLKKGDMICVADQPTEVADQFETTIFWLSDEAMMAGRPYTLKLNANTLDASITALKYIVKVDSDEHIAASQLLHNQIGICNISLSARVPFEPLSAGRKTSQFNLYDKVSGELIGIGALHFALRRASNVHWQALDVTRQSRSQMKGQKPAILWFTGLSGSGKSAIANLVEMQLSGMGYHTYTLDGDNVRHGLNRDLGFTDADRVENIRRIGEVSRLMADSGLITLVSFISPFRSERQLARDLAEEGEFIEIHVDTPLEVAEQRDVKGLYKKARAGEIKNFTGLDSPYEVPENPEIRIDTVTLSAQDAADEIVQSLHQRGIISLK